MTNQMCTGTYKAHTFYVRTNSKPPLTSITRSGANYKCTLARQRAIIWFSATTHKTCPITSMYRENTRQAHTSHTQALTLNHHHHCPCLCWSPHKIHKAQGSSQQKRAQGRAQPAVIWWIQHQLEDDNTLVAKIVTTKLLLVAASLSVALEVIRL